MFPGSNAIYSTKCASVLPTIHRWYHRVIVFVQVKRSRLSNLPWVIQLLCSTANTIPVSQCLYFIHQLSSGKSQVVCIGQDNSKRLISKQTNKQSNGANVFFFFFSKFLQPFASFPRLQELKVHPNDIVHFASLEKAGQNTRVPRNPGSGKQESPFQHKRGSGLRSPKLCLPRTPLLLGTVRSIPIYVVAMHAPASIWHDSGPWRWQLNQPWAPDPSCAKPKGGFLAHTGQLLPFLYCF